MIESYLQVAKATTMRNIREHSRAIVRQYLLDVADSGLFDGRVLDYGCGHQPYRDLIKGEYCPYDLASEPTFQHIDMPEGEFDAVVLTYVLGYGSTDQILRECASKLKRGGRIVGAYANTWPEIETSYLYSLTPSGLRDAFEKIPELELTHHSKGTMLQVNDFVVQINGVFTAVRTAC